MKTKVPIRPAYRINEFCQAFGLSRSTVYEQIDAGELRRTKVGSIVLIAGRDAIDWLERRRTGRPRAVNHGA